MENQTEKSIEQIALENYGKEKLDEKYNTIAVTIGIVIGILSAIFFVFLVLDCENCLHDYGMIIFGTIVVGVMMGMFTVICILLLYLASRGNEKSIEKIEKLISLLSNEEKKKIISDYIQKEIKSWQENIPYCNDEIQKLQSEIDELKEEIEESNKIIPELQEKLKNL